MKRTIRKYSAVVIILFIGNLAVFSQKQKESNSTDLKVEIVDSRSNQSEKSPTKEILDYLFKLLGPGVALFGIIATLPLLRKKLTENHISNELNNIQRSNSEIQKFNQELIDKYSPYTYTNEILNKDNLEIIYDDIQKVYKISLDASSDVSTLMFYIKRTLETSIRHYDKSAEIFSTRNFFSFLINMLELVNFYSTQAVQIPKSSKVEKQDLIRESLKKYVTHSHILKYKYFKRGVIEDPNSAHFTLFSEKVNHTNISLLMRSIYQVYWRPNAIAKILYINKIYAPLIIKTPFEKGIFGKEEKTLFLIGYNGQTSFGSDGEKKTIDLYYSNLEDNFHFTSTITPDIINSAYFDCYIIDSEFDFNNHTQIVSTGIETVKIKFDKDYLINQYEVNKGKFKNKLTK